MSRAIHYNTTKTGRRSRRARRRRRIFLVCILLILVFALLKFASASGGMLSRMTALRMEQKGYPQSLVELMERNPETEQFVMDYFDKKDLNQEIDISGDVKSGEFPLFLQWDERWGYKSYGGDFLAVTGCGPTCLSMVYCGLSGDTRWNPYEVARMAEENGYYVEGSGSSWDLMSSGAEKLGLKSEAVVFDESHIREKLQGGHPVICSVGPGDFTSAGHFIVLCGIKDNGEIIVHDPNSRKNSEKSWDLERLMSQIKNLWSYSI